MKSLVIPVGIDLGAINTGLVIMELNENNIKTEGFVINIDKDNITLSQTERTIKRHMRRNIKRKVLCRKLVLSWWNEISKNIEIIKSEKIKLDEFICGLLKKRGFTYTPKEKKKGDDKKKEEITPWAKSRETYFTEIKKEIENNSILYNILNKLKINSLEFTRIIGHFSNLQLRYLRKYYIALYKNDKKKNEWEEAIFANIFVKYLKAQNISKKSPEYTKEKNNKDEMLKQLNILNTNKVIDIIKNLSKIDAKYSIPPYENQNNRRPPKCKSLIFCTKTLDDKYKKWQEWTKEISFMYKKDYLLNFNEFKTELKTEKQKNARILQRMLDFSGRYAYENKIPKISTEGGNKKYKYELLSPLKFSEEDKKTFMELVKNYEREKHASKERTRNIFNTDKNLLKECAKHPKLKEKLKDVNLARILGVNIYPNLITDFEKIWTKKIDGLQIKKLAEDTADIMKKTGTNGKNEVLEALKKNKIKNEEASDVKKSTKKSKNEAKEIKDIYEIGATEIVNALGLDKFGAKTIERAVAKFANPYSFAQLYQIIEKDSGGFSSTCICCSEDNYWRNAGEMAKCQSFVSNPIRPFDGVLARLSEKIGINISKKINDKLKTILTKDDEIKIKIPVFLEQNRFSFVEEIKKIKNKKTDKIVDDTDKRWSDKRERICESVKGICPYCGKALSENYDIDHIIPRAKSKALLGFILNSEANLIAVHKDCNAHKADRQKELKDLSTNYLQKIFNTDNVKEIEQKISAYFENNKSSESKAFFEYSESEQNYLRHALFHSDNIIKQKATKMLSQQYKTRVNGSQAWLFLKILEKVYKNVKENYKNSLLIMEPIFVDVLEAKDWRHKFEKLELVPEKKEKQPVYSHVADATAVVIAGLQKTDVLSQSENLQENFEKILQDNEIKNLLPTSLEIVEVKSKKINEKDNIQSSAIFKDTKYSENFFNIIVTSGAKLYVGFCAGVRHSVEIKKDKEKFVLNIKEFIDTNSRPWKTFGDLVALVNQKTGVQVFAINKIKAQEYLFKVSRGEKENNDASKKLENMLYYTTKISVESMFWDSKEFTDLNVEKNMKKFSTTYEKKKIYYPAQKEWEKLCKLKEFEEWKILREDKTASDITINEKYFALQHKFAPVPNNKRERGGIHGKGIGGVFSLPIIKSPSGGFRIRRKNRLKNEDVWQILVANQASKAYLIDKKTKKLDDSNLLLIFDKNNTKNISPTKLDNILKDPKQKQLNMNDFYEIYDKDNIKILASANSKDRCEIKIETTMQNFTKHILPYFKLEKNEEKLDKIEFKSLMVDKKISEVEGHIFNVELASRPRDSSTPKGGTISFIKISDELVSFKYISENGYQNQITKILQKAMESL